MQSSETPLPFSVFSPSSTWRLASGDRDGALKALSLLALLPCQEGKAMRRVTPPLASIASSVTLGTQSKGVQTGSPCPLSFAAIQSSVDSLFRGDAENQGGRWLCKAISRDIEQGQQVKVAAPFASVSSSLLGGRTGPQRVYDIAMPVDQIAPRLESVPVYAVVSSANEFVLIASKDNSVKLGFFCFSEADARALLQEIKDKDVAVGRHARVEPVSLDKVYRLPKVEGVAFRFLPQAQQIQNAIEVNKKKGIAVTYFDGVPVFQSRSLTIRAGNQRYLPVFFAKEDLVKSLELAHGKMTRNKMLGIKPDYDIEVGQFENVLKLMEGADAGSNWREVVFIPPGQVDFMKTLKV
eukprot:jgi/Mesvir1/10795/Mv13845-RA.1